MMSLDEIKELNNKWQKDKNIAYEYNGTELQTLNGEHIGVDLMLSDEGLELQICKVIGFNNQNEKMWETFALESIDIDKINSDNELENYLQERIDEYENEIKNVSQKTIMENQQEKLTLGILKLQETYKTLKELNFSDCVLNEINNIIDDLKGLIEEEKYEKIIKESEK